MAECESCVQSKLIEQLTERVDRLEAKHDNNDTRISNLEKNNAVNEEQIKMVFKILSEIKDDIKIIANKLDRLEKEPADKWKDTMKEITRTVITIAIAGIVSYFSVSK